MTDFSSSHYSFAQRPGKMMAWARCAASEFTSETVVAYWRDKIPLLIYSGMSGVAHAEALARELYISNVHFEMMYVRKNEEISNGLKIEHSVSGHGKECFALRYFVFVDDFMVSGSTLRHCSERPYQLFGHRFDNGLAILRDRIIHIPDIERFSRSNFEHSISINHYQRLTFLDF